MDLGWGTVAQAVITAIATVIIRKNTKTETAKVISGTAAQTTSDCILSKVNAIELDVQILKRAQINALKIDNRGPSKE